MIDSVQQKKAYSNFDVMFKHTIKNVYTRVTTYVAYAVFLVITCTMLILTLVLKFNGKGNDTGGIEKFIGNLMEQIFYATTLVLAICSSLIASCILELNETTFELSRPISRRTFIGAKSSVGLITNGSMYVWYLIVFIVCQEIIHQKTGIYVFSHKGTQLNYATLFVPSLLAMLFATFMTFLLRPFIIKKEGLISVVIVLFMFLTYQLYPLIFLAINGPASSKFSDVWLSCLILPGAVFGVGAICSIYGTFLVYDKLYVKV